MSIKALEDADGNALTDAEEAEYWTVKPGFRETTVDAADGGADTGLISLGTDQAEVYEGAEVIFTLTRSGGPVGRATTVRLDSWEPNRQIGFNNDPSYQTHFVTFETLAHYSPAERQRLRGRCCGGEGDTLTAQILDVGDGYQKSGPPLHQRRNQGPVKQQHLHRNSPRLTDCGGGSCRQLYPQPQRGHLRRRNGEPPVRRPPELLRGNHWDPAPRAPHGNTHPGRCHLAHLEVPVPDDHRDIDGQSFTLHVAPSDDYLLGNAGLGAHVAVSVTDNDDAQELEFTWGYLDNDASWKTGESWLTSTPGPAEASSITRTAAISSS